MISASLETLLLAAVRSDGQKVCVESGLSTAIWNDFSRDNACVFAELGNVFLRLLETLSELAEELVCDVPRSQQYINERLNEQAGIGGQQRLDINHLLHMSKENAAWKYGSSRRQLYDAFANARRRLQCTLKIAALQMREEWNQCPRPPQLSSYYSPATPTPQSDISFSSPSFESQNHQDRIVPQVEDYLPVDNLSDSSSSCSEDIENESTHDHNQYMPMTQLEDHFQDKIVKLINRTSKRGKGSYTCPLGLGCPKKGTENGELITWLRNSDFKTHLQKHVRLWKCDAPSCKHREGFARRDQLERHLRETRVHGNTKTDEEPKRKTRKVTEEDTIEVHNLNTEQNDQRGGLEFEGSEIIAKI